MSQRRLLRLLLLLVAAVTLATAAATTATPSPGTTPSPVSSSSASTTPAPSSSPSASASTTAASASNETSSASDSFGSSSVAPALSSSGSTSSNSSSSSFTPAPSPATSSDSSNVPPPNNNTNMSSGSNTTDPGSGSHTIVVTDVTTSSDERLYGVIIGVGCSAVVAAVVLYVLLRRQKKKHLQMQHKQSSLELTPARENGEMDVDAEDTDEHSTLNTASTKRKFPSNHLSTSFLSTAESGSGDSYTDATLGAIWQDPVIVAARLPLQQIEVFEVISRGGFGEVYDGQYQGGRVAVKRLLPKTRNVLQCLEDFLLEVKIMAALDHERIVTFVGVAWDSPRDLCIVSEFMDRGDLRNVLCKWRDEGEKPGWNAQRLRIALHVAEALTYLHALSPKKIIHRDLKSKNVLVSQNWDAKLSDFGISREQATQHRTMTCNIGSSLWMAPEIMLGKNYDESADVFSFGVMLTELDSLEYPYHGVTTPDGRPVPEAAIVHMVALGNLQAEFSQMSRTDMVLLGRACLSVDPQRRPSAAVLVEKIQRALSKTK